MAVLLAFELTSQHARVREELMNAGYLNSMIGYHTTYLDKIQSDLPSTFLFHPTADAAEALRDLRESARRCGIDIEDRQQRAFALYVEPEGAKNWRGIVSRFHPSDEE